MPRPAHDSIDLGDGADDYTDEEEEANEGPYEKEPSEKAGKLGDSSAKIAKSKSKKYIIDPQTGQPLIDPATNEPVEVERKPREKRVVLDGKRLSGETGLHALVKEFSDVNWHGKGREDENLMLLMGKLEGWAHRMFPKYKFDDVLDKVERLGSKREVRTTVKKLLVDMPILPEDFVSHSADNFPNEPIIPSFNRKLLMPTSKVNSENSLTTLPTGTMEFDQDDEWEAIAVQAEEEEARRTQTDREKRNKSPANDPISTPTVNSPENDDEQLTLEDAMDFVNMDD